MFFVLNKNTGIQIFCITFFFFSCDNVQEIEVDFPFHTPQMVINALYEHSDKEFAVTLNVSQRPDQTDYWHAVSDADVRLTVNEVVYTAIEKEAGKYFFIFLPTEGQEYEITAYHPQFGTITATDRVPVKVEVDNIMLTPNAGIDAQGDYFSNFAITLVKGIKETFIEIQVKFVSENQIINEIPKLHEFDGLTTNEAMITSQSWYPSILHIGRRSPRSLLFSDRSISENTYTVQFQHTSGLSSWSHETGWQPGKPEGEIIVFIRSVSENYFRYKTGVIEQEYAVTGVLLFGAGEPVPVFSNVQGGLGIVASRITNSETFKQQNQ